MMKKVFLIGVMVIFLTLITIFNISSKDEENDIDNVQLIELPSQIEDQDELEFLMSNFELLPEQQISIYKDKNLYAMYAEPTDRYTHGILGDIIEASRLIVLYSGKIYELTLGDEYVFEDISPILSDVDGDGIPEVITIRAHKDLGAAIVVYKITDDNLKEFAYVPEIGQKFRWLNIAAINDLGDDGDIEIAWIQTPHIGGVLKIGTIKTGEIRVADQISLYSNHAIGERNQDLSVLEQKGERKILHVPTQDRNMIVGFSFEDGVWQKESEINHEVDFSLPLSSQFEFEDLIDKF